MSGQLTRASFTVFLPKMLGEVSPKPLFPSYLFIYADFENQFIHRLVRYTRGVSHLLGDKEGPQPVDDLIVETLRERTRDGSLIEQELLLREGDSVRIKKGVLQDLIGIVEKNMIPSRRIKVLFKWLNGPMKAVLRYKDVEKIAL